MRMFANGNIVQQTLIKTFAAGDIAAMGVSVPQRVGCDPLCHFIAESHGIFRLWGAYSAIAVVVTVDRETLTLVVHYNTYVNICHFDGSDANMSDRKLSPGPNTLGPNACHAL